MKKVIVLLLAATLIAMIIAVLKRAQALPRTSRVATLLSTDTLLFFHVPDVRRTHQRWPQTALAQIAREPEVQAFFARPLSKLPQQGPEAQRWRDQIERLDVQEVFFAVPAWPENGMPKLAAGFSFQGKKENAEGLLRDVRSRAQSAWPASKSDIIKFRTGEIETFTVGNFTAAWALWKDWVFAANDLELLKSTLTRFEETAPANSLRNSTQFHACLKQMPGHFDAILFAQTRTVTERLVSFLTMTNPGLDPHQFDEFRKIEAFSAIVKCEDKNIRDAMFVLKPGEKKQPLMQGNSLTLSSSNTLLYYAALNQIPANIDTLLEPKEQSGMMASPLAAGAGEWVGRILKALASQGPELSVQLDWSPMAMQPALLLSTEIRDKAEAQNLIKAITGGGENAANAPSAEIAALWEKEETGEATFYKLDLAKLPGMFRVMVTPIIALTDKFLLLGLSTDSVKSAVEHAKAGNRALVQSDAFRKASESVHEPSLAFAYVDSRTLFERLYGAFRPFAVLGLSLAYPRIGDYVDLGKLPTTETIGKHLGPIAYSQTALDDGVLSESVGPVTLSQAAVALGVGAAAAVIQKQLLNSGDGVFALRTSPVLPAPPVTSVSARPARMSSNTPQSWTLPSWKPEASPVVSDFRNTANAPQVTP